MYFLEKYTSNEVETKIKNAFQSLKKVFKGNLVIPPAIIGIWLFAQANILRVFFREIYVQMKLKRR